MPIKGLFLFLALSLLFTETAFPQADTVLPEPKAFPVTFHHDTLFFLFDHLGPFSPRERADAVSDQLRAMQHDFRQDSFSVTFNNNLAFIKYRKDVLMVITKLDAQASGKKQKEVATEYTAIIKNALMNQIETYSWKMILLNTLFLILGIGGLLLIIFLISKSFNWLVHKIQARKLPEEMSSRLLGFLSPDRARKYWIYIIKFIRVTVILLFLALYIPLLFSFLPWTEGFARKIYGYILSPLKTVLFNFIDFIPDLFFIVVILVLTYYLLKFLHYLATEVEKERIKIRGFFADWAVPTFQLVRILILIFAFIIIFPYLPGSNSPAFKGISIFIGVLVSLGSTSAISNLVAGIVITYMRPFQIGDRVRIGETVGDVIEKNFLLTRVRTIKNEAVTIPNSQILANHMFNYTRNAEELGLVLHTSVTIGYDVPWKEVHALLMGAANDCKSVLDDPSPFVLQKRLEDFAVEYELNAYTREPKYMTFAYSELHKCIQNRFAKAGVEIMSPHYRSIRDGNKRTVPEDLITGEEETEKVKNEKDDENESGNS